MPLILAALLLPLSLSLPALPAHALRLDLAGVTCDSYERRVLRDFTPGPGADPIDVVMWLFGFSVARAGERVMYGDALPAFGFALDAECKNQPAVRLLDAVTAVHSKRDNPMDLTRLGCAEFLRRHAEVRKSDPESADTLTMWLFGYAVGLAGGRTLDTDGLEQFDAGLIDRCEKNAQTSVFDALGSPNPAIAAPAPPPRRAPNPSK